ncbi:MAG: phenylalanine--tRNA ligase subunit beta [Planctomycetes bacterium]|nr:phenylalanine--tRNA ligase subunit beta [Planctomycetota bacterium]
MKVSLNWLTDYVDIALPAAELAALLTRIGLEVEPVFDQTDSDLIFEVEVTSNRPDCLGHIGLAREIAAATGAALKLPDLDNVPATGDVREHTGVEVLDPVFCPRYTARLLRGVKVGPSPAWMVERLEAVGLRSINNVVDVTNYVLMEYSQPLHAFDFDTLHGRRIVVRRARDGEFITAIDGSKHELRDWMGIIADADRPVAVAGVMGGLDTEVSEKTTNVLIEAAQFDPLVNRRTSRALNLMSDASYRFERGIDPVGLERASMRACRLILELAGGRLLDGIVDVWAAPYKAPVVAMRTARCSALLGIDVPVADQTAILDALHLAPRRSGKSIKCTIPPHRPDLTREVDLIEEVGRIYGLDRIPIGGSVTHEVKPPSATESARREAGAVLNAAGYFEAITATFIDAAEAELFGWTGSLAVDPRLRKTNGVLRQGILPNLLRSWKVNQDAGNEDVRLFELAAVFPPAPAGDGGTLPAEYVQLALLTGGALTDVRGALEAVVGRFDPRAALAAEAADAAGFAPGEAAKLTLVTGGRRQEFGVMGRLDAKVADHYGLTTQPAGAMVHFEALLAMGRATRTYAPLPRFPAIRRDLSVVVDEPVTWERLTAAAVPAAGELLAGIDYVGAYRGKQAGGGRKSVTLRLVFRHGDRTLTHEEVDAAIEGVVAALKGACGAELRT